MAAMMKLMEQKLQDLTENVEKSRQLYPASMTDAFDADADGTDDLQGKMSAIPEITTAMGTTWTIICGALVMFMHAGFALLETGVCRAVSCQSILMKNILNVCFGTLIWFLFGYALMYGGNLEILPIMIFGGAGGFFGDGMVDTAAGGGAGMGWIGPNHLVTCQ